METLKSNAGLEAQCVDTEEQGSEERSVVVIKRAVAETLRSNATWATTNAQPQLPPRIDSRRAPENALLAWWPAQPRILLIYAHAGCSLH